MSQSNIKNAMASLITGIVFAIGLGISGMTMPSKVLGFLDLFGNFDASLIFVMVGAIIVHFITFRIVKKRHHPVLDEKWHVPTKTEITPALVSGAFIFGFGWALGGMCPGPAITNLASFDSTPIIFVVSMLVGMYLFRFVDGFLKLNK